MSVHAEEDALKYARIILETVEANDGQAPVSNRTARLLASALLSLAAESEELRAENERLKQEQDDARYEHKEAMERMEDQA